MDYRDSKVQRLTQEILKSYRKSGSITQVELAEKLGVPQSFVSKYESGERILSISEVRIICLVLGRTLIDFVNDLEERN